MENFGVPSAQSAAKRRATGPNFWLCEEGALLLTIPHPEKRLEAATGAGSMRIDGVFASP